MADVTGGVDYADALAAADSDDAGDESSGQENRDLSVDALVTGIEAEDDEIQIVDQPDYSDEEEEEDLEENEDLEDEEPEGDDEDEDLEEESSDTPPKKQRAQERIQALAKEKNEANSRIEQMQQQLNQFAAMQAFYAKQQAETAQAQAQARAERETRMREQEEARAEAARMEAMEPYEKYEYEQQKMVSKLAEEKARALVEAEVGPLKKQWQEAQDYQARQQQVYQQQAKLASFEQEADRVLMEQVFSDETARPESLDSMREAYLGLVVGTNATHEEAAKKFNEFIDQAYQYKLNAKTSLGKKKAAGRQLPAPKSRGGVKSPNKGGNLDWGTFSSRGGTREEYLRRFRGK